MATTNKIFIYAFLFLYTLVAFISFCHAIEFFDIGNVHWMSVMLAFAFELGLAVCLASILIGTNKRNNVAWLLLVILVLVQVIGNTYSVFKFISESGRDYYNYLAKPMLFMIEEVSQETVQVIISWIMGAILPIVALLMTEMVANGIKIDTQINNKDDDIDSITDNSEDVHENEHKIQNDDNNRIQDEKIEHDNIDIIDNDKDDHDVKEEITPFENKSVIESEETTVNSKENTEFVEQRIKENETEVENINYNKNIINECKEPKQVFDELKKESLN